MKLSPFGDKIKDEQDGKKNRLNASRSFHPLVTSTTQLLKGTREMVSMPHEAFTLW